MTTTPLVLVESLRGTASSSDKYLPSSAFEYPLRAMGFSNLEAQQYATVVDLAWGFNAGRVVEQTIQTGFVLQPKVAALLNLL